MSSRLLTMSAALAAVLLLAACANTVRGVGQDVRETGEAVEDAVQ